MSNNDKDFTPEVGMFNNLFIGWSDEEFNFLRHFFSQDGEVQKAQLSEHHPTINQRLINYKFTVYSGDFYKLWPFILLFDIWYFKARDCTF